MNALKDWRFRLSVGSGLVGLVGILLDVAVLGIAGSAGYVVGAVLFVRKYPL